MVIKNGEFITIKKNFSGELERERILLQYFKEYIADPATSASRKQRLKLADFDWIEKVKEVARQTDGMSGRELSKLVFGWQVNIFLLYFHYAYVRFSRLPPMPRTTVC